MGKVGEIITLQPPQHSACSAALCVECSPVSSLAESTALVDWTTSCKNFVEDILPTRNWVENQ